MLNSATLQTLIPDALYYASPVLLLIGLVCLSVCLALLLIRH